MRVGPAASRPPFFLSVNYCASIVPHHNTTPHHLTTTALAKQPPWPQDPQPSLHMLVAAASQLTSGGLPSIPSAWLVPRQKNEPPAHSPDIHKVIEHPLSPFNAAWYKEFTLDTRCTSARTAMDKASEILHRTKADSIWKDIQTLPDTLHSVLHNSGDWADHGLC